MSKINDGGPAFYQPPQDEYSYGDTGLSKREIYAGLALQGILAGYWSNSDMGGLGPHEFAQDAVANADALIAALEST